MNEKAPTIYLSGPMSIYGVKGEWGKPIFDTFAARYRAFGYTVISPPEHDPEILGGEPFEPGNYAQCLAADVKLLTGMVERIYMLPEWRKSKGATLERLAAETVGIPVYDASTGKPMTTRLIVAEVHHREVQEEA